MTLSGAVATHGNCRGWGEIRLREALTQRKEFGRPDLPLLGVSLVAGVRPRFAEDGRPAASSDLSGYKVVHPGDVVMNALGKPHGSIGRSGTEGITSPAYWVLKCREQVDSRYVHYLLRSGHMVEEYQRLGKYLPPNQFDISWEVFREISIPLPPLDVQSRIAAFLDDQVARIDDAYGLRATQIVMVNQWQQSSVTEDFVRLTRSHGLVRLRFWVRSLRQGWSPECESRAPESGEWGVLKAGCTNGGVFRADELKTLPPAMAPREAFRVRPGDLLINRASGSPDLIGSAAVVPATCPGRILFSDKTYRVDLRPGVVPEYVAGLWLSRQVREALRLGISGAEGMANSLPAAVIRNIQLPKAPEAAQRTWVAENASRAARHAQLISALGASRRLLMERKRSLITAAVTGEFDVTTASSRAAGVALSGVGGV